MKQIFLFITLVLLVIKYFSQQLDMTVRFVAENLFLKSQKQKSGAWDLLVAPANEVKTRVA